ncbi:MAG: ribose 5-phosphate isomerase A, partial [Ginsengibacter sp.]
MDLKKAAAEEALKFIQPNTIIGLGAGSTIAHLAHMIKAKFGSNMPLSVCSSSFTTLAILKDLQFNIVSINDIDGIDIYFDGCDEVDGDLNALKSGGGIHTLEKLHASLSKTFIILGDEQKLVKQFTGNIPLVSEILPLASSYVFNQIQNLFRPSKMDWRMSKNSDGPLTTASGNYLLDIYFTAWPELSILNTTLKQLT